MELIKVHSSRHGFMAETGKKRKLRSECWKIDSSKAVKYHKGNKSAKIGNWKDGNSDTSCKRITLKGGKSNLLKEQNGEKKQVTSEIDDLFASVKKVQKNKEQEDIFKRKNIDKETRKRKGKFLLKKEGRAKLRARTGEGLPIYTEKELKIGMGGYTSACPFDCKCCF